MTCLKGVKAVLARTMFSLHALVTLWRLVSQGQVIVILIVILIRMKETEISSDQSRCRRLLFKGQ